MWTNGLMSSLDDKDVILLITIVSDDQSCHSHATVNTHHFFISPPDIHHFFISLCDHHFVVRHSAILTISSIQVLAHKIPHFLYTLSLHQKQPTLCGVPLYYSLLPIFTIISTTELFSLESVRYRVKFSKHHFVVMLVSDPHIS